MTSAAAALNHGRRCVEELDRFDHLMGWTFRAMDGYHESDGDELSREIRAAKQRELACTAFGSVVEIPCEFAAPISSSSTSTKSDQRPAKHKPRKKTVAVATPSGVNSKRVTGPTTASTGRSSAANNSSQKTGGTSSKTAIRGGAYTSAPPSAHDRSPVDFEYDVIIRRRLREEIDSERAKTLRDAAEKESQLRAANKWVYDTRTAGDRKQAWNGVEPQEQLQRGSIETASGVGTSRCAGAKASARASSAARSRGKPPPSHASRPPLKRSPVKSSVAPNVSEWRTQAFPAHQSPDAAASEWRRAEQQRRRWQQQAREAKDVHDTIDDFELRMRRLATSL